MDISLHGLNSFTKNCVIVIIIQTLIWLIKIICAIMHFMSNCPIVLVSASQAFFFFQSHYFLLKLFIIKNVLIKYG